MSAWSLKTTERFDKELKALDRPVQQRIKKYLDEVIASDDPRSRGKALTGPLAGLWRYRVGDYRVEVEIIETEITIVAVKVGHRSEIYD